MCAIGGITFLQNAQFLDIVAIVNGLNKMLVSGQDRGRDCTGVVAVYEDGSFMSCRLNLPADKFIMHPDYQSFLMDLRFEGLKHLITNNRAQPIPEGESTSEKNRQPIMIPNWVGSHNGTISNDKELVGLFELETETQIDSEVVLRMLEEHLPIYQGDLASLVQDVCRNLSGGMSFACVNSYYPGRLILFTNFKPLTIAVRKATEGNEMIIYNSEKKNIENAFGKDDLLYSDYKYQELKPYTGMIVDTETQTLDEFKISTRITAHIPKSYDRRALVICSGGLDSCTAATVAKKLHNMKQVTLLHFNYGQIAYASEKRAIEATARAIGGASREIDMSWLGELSDSPLVNPNTPLPKGIDSAESTKCWVPARNLLILSVAAAYAEAKGYQYIYSGFNLEEGGSYPDNVVPFFKAMNHAFDYGTLTRVKLVLALERLMKPEIIKLGTHLGTPLDKTWSCDLGGDIPCGTCGCCFTRQMAYLKAGIPDPQVYQNVLTEKPVWADDPNFVRNDVSIEQILEKVRDIKIF
jgi:7-cyano-7-deazaguanine synthase